VTVTNTLGYNTAELITAVKSFIGQDPDEGKLIWHLKICPSHKKWNRNVN